MLISDIFDNIIGYFRTGDERSVKAKQNTFYMFFIKGGTILIGLLLVPVTLSYVDSDTYGIWLTLSSMITWISFFDIGLNNGLKNKLTQALAARDYELGRKYVSTTYALLTLIFIPVMVLLLVIAPLLDWSALLHITVNNSRVLLVSVAIIIVYFCITFVLSTINIVLMADQRPADASFRTFIQQLFSLVIIFILTKTTKGDLVNLCIGLCISPIIILLLFNFYLFTTRYKYLKPSFKYVDFGTAPDLMKLGVQFFLIQIAGVIQFQMVNFLIIRHFGPSEVTSYNIAHKYFNVLYMLWGIVITPLWAAVTDAFAKKDFSWVKRARSKYARVMCLMLGSGVLMLAISPLVYRIWVGQSVSISFALSFWVFLYTAVMIYGSLYVNILNGAGVLKTQTIICCISPLVFLASVKVLTSFGVGASSIIIASIVANFNGFVVAPIQVNRLINNKIS